MRPLYLSLAIFGLYHTPKHSQVEPARHRGPKYEPSADPAQSDQILLYLHLLLDEPECH